MAKWSGFSIRLLILPSPSDPKQPRRFLPLPKGLVELYGLIAVLMVVIPEWLAEVSLNMGNSTSEAQLPMRARAWRTLPELQLAAMNLSELRQLAHQLKLWGYASESRDQLSRRLLRRLSRRLPSKRIRSASRQRNTL